MGLGAACGAVATALLLDLGGDDEAAAPDHYTVVLSADIGPDALSAPEGMPQAELLFEHALLAPNGVASESRLAKATDGDVLEHRIQQMPRGETPARGGAEHFPGSTAGSGTDGEGLAVEKTLMVLAAEAPLDSEAAAAKEAELDLTRRERREVQRRLQLTSHDPKLVDGIFGPATRAAIGSWQAAAGLPVTGFLDRNALALLGRQTEDEYRAWRAAEAARARKRRTEMAQLHSPLPPVSPAGVKCRRDGTGGIAYGQNMRCDIRGLGEELRDVRDNFVELIRGAERS